MPAAAEGASSLGVLGIEDALHLRKSGVRVPIVLLGPPQVENAGEIVRNRIIPTVDSMNFLKALDKAASMKVAGRPADLTEAYTRYIEANVSLYQQTARSRGVS